MYKSLFLIYPHIDRKKTITVVNDNIIVFIAGSSAKIFTNANANINIEGIIHVNIYLRVVISLFLTVYMFLLFTVKTALKILDKNRQTLYTCFFLKSFKDKISISIE